MTCLGVDRAMAHVSCDNIHVNNVIQHVSSFKISCSATLQLCLYKGQTLSLVNHQQRCSQLEKVQLHCGGI